MANKLINPSWVFSTELPSAEDTGHTLYNPASSSTAELLVGETWNITYGDGSGASGNVYTDTVSVGTTTVTNQAVELANSVSAQFEQDNSDGLLGLAFNSINTVAPTQQKTFFSNALSSLAAPLFTADLMKGAPGSYDFGFIDSSKYTGSITYVPVNTANGFWEFTASGYAVGSSAFVSSSIDAIADTGTTLLLVPQALVVAYYRQVKGARNDPQQGGYTFPCSASLPSVTLGIGAYQAVVPGDYINYSPISEGSSSELIAFLVFSFLFGGGRGCLKGLCWRGGVGWLVREFMADCFGLRSLLRWHPVEYRHRVFHLWGYLPEEPVCRL